jgi:predicted transposase YdaD
MECDEADSDVLPEVIWLKSLIFYVMINTEISAEQVVAAMREVSPQRGAEMAGRAAREFFGQGLEQGRQEGMQRGMQQGVKKGESTLLGRQLTLKFGALPEEVEQRLEQADCAQLEAWSERILFANSLDEVFTPPTN